MLSVRRPRTAWLGTSAAVTMSVSQVILVTLISLLSIMLILQMIVEGVQPPPLCVTQSQESVMSVWRTLTALQTSQTVTREIMCVSQVGGDSHQPCDH